jgi:hypothetical protein
MSLTRVGETDVRPTHASSHQGVRRAGHIDEQNLIITQVVESQQHTATPHS